jgi:hypothetical protein
MGVVVPPASGRARDAHAPVSGGARVKDSVELLLEGMGGPRPDRTKTMPQSAGEASAAYHAEHALQAGRTAPDEKKKVLVDTVRLPAATEGDAVGFRHSADPTFVVREKLGPRIVVAAIAGFLVVLAIFAYLDRAPASSASDLPDTRHETLGAAAPPPPVAAPEPPVAATATAATPPAPEAPPAPASAIEAPPAAGTALASRPHGSHRKTPGDVGEFKTSF